MPPIFRFLPWISLLSLRVAFAQPEGALATFDSPRTTPAGQAVELPLEPDNDFSFTVTFSLSSLNDATLFEWGATPDRKGKRHFLALELIHPGNMPVPVLGAYFNGSLVCGPADSLADGGEHTAVFRVRDGVKEFFLDGIIQERAGDRGTFSANFDMIQRFAAASDALIPQSGLVFGRDLRARYPFGGDLARVAFWNLALTDSEIRDLSGVEKVESKWERYSGYYEIGGRFYDPKMPLEKRFLAIQEDYEAHYRRSLSENRYFPRIHVTVPGFITEPGTSFHSGTYHLWPHGHFEWGLNPTHLFQHLTSEDLAHWKYEPLPGWTYARACNIAVLEGSGQGVVYTNNAHRKGADGVWAPGLQRWTSDDEGHRSWKRQENIPLPLPDSDVPTLDHWIFRYEEEWLMIGAAPGAEPESGRQPTLELYRAADDTLSSWTYVGPFYTGDHAAHHPKIFFVGGKAVLFSDLAIDDDGQYVIGRIEDGRFVKEGAGRFHLDEENANPFGGVITMDEGRNLLFFWMRDSFWHADHIARDAMREGWLSAYSVPREITLDEDGETLLFAPAPELAALRSNPLHRSERLDLGPGLTKLPLEGGHTGCFELATTLDLANESAAEIVLQAGADDSIRIACDSEGNLSLDLRGAKRAARNTRGKGIAAGQIPLREGRFADLRVFWDHSLLEVYANGRCLAAWWRPDEPATVEVACLGLSGSASLVDTSVWSLSTIWKEFAGNGSEGKNDSEAEKGLIGEAAVAWRFDGNDLVELKASGDAEIVAHESASDGSAASMKGGFFSVVDPESVWEKLPPDEDFTIYVRYLGAEDPFDGQLLSSAGEAGRFAVDLGAWEIPWGSLSRQNLGLRFGWDDRKVYKAGFNHRLAEDGDAGWRTLIIRTDFAATRNYLANFDFPATDVSLDGEEILRSWYSGRSMLGRLFVPKEQGIWVGAEPGGRFPFQGWVDDLVIWDRRLSDGEVEELTGKPLRKSSQWREQAPQNLDSFGGELFADEIPKEERIALLDREMPAVIALQVNDSPYKPRFHVGCPGVNMNTHAITYRGVHHLFPITAIPSKNYPGYNPHVYRHFVSEDYVTWKPMPLLFGQAEFFPNATFAVTNDEVWMLAGPRASYARSSDPLLKKWEVLGSVGNLQDHNPPESGTNPWREFAILREEDRWLAVTMGVARDGMDSHLFASDDLKTWTHEGVFSEFGKGECLSIASVEGKKVLFNLHYGDFDYQVGQIEGGKFCELARGKSALCSTRILAAVDADEKGTFQALWQMAGNHPFGSKEETRLGFSNTYSLPQVFGFREDDSMRFSPHESVSKLRGEEISVPGFELENSEKIIAGLHGAHREVEMTAEPGGVGRLGLVLRNNGFEVRVGADYGRREYFLDMRKAPPHTAGAGSLLRLPFHEEDEEFHLRLFFDGSLVEAYVNGSVLFDWVLFPNPEQIEFGAFSERGSMKVTELRSWEMRSIWKDIEEGNGN